MDANRVTLYKETPSRKLGVKFLDDNQLNNTFPDWKSLLGRIEEQRLISNFMVQNGYHASQEHLPQMYDNVYAILGGRGTGKSSVLLTLRNHIQRKCPQDIMLPIITPEVISSRECSILGWIMSSAEVVVEETERLIEERGGNVSRTGAFRWLDDFFDNCQFQKKNHLRNCYQELFARSVSTSATGEISGYSMEDVVCYKVGQSRRQYKLMRDLNTFWELLSDTWARANSLPTRKIGPNEGISEDLTEKRPLIILTFDDIDLAPERSMELLTTTFQYLTAPNIVIILTAAEKVLNEVIRLKMIERMIGSDSVSLLQEFISKDELTEAKWPSDTENTNQIARMTEEFYNKVIPPANRYSLRRYKNIEERKLYFYSSTVQSFAPPEASYAIPIETFLKEQVDMLVDTLVKAGSIPNADGRNFLMGGQDDQVFRDVYLLMFGPKSRNITNGCLEVMNTFSRLRELISAREGWQLDAQSHLDVLFTLRHLMRSLLLSNPELKDFSEIVDELIHAKHDRHWIFINYPLVWELYQTERTNIRRQVRSNPFINGNPATNSGRIYLREKELFGAAKQRLCALMVILFFVESILCTLDREKRELHGYRELSSLLNADALNLEMLGSGGAEWTLFPAHYPAQQFLEQSPLVLEHAARYVSANPYDLHQAHAYLLDIFDAKIKCEDVSPGGKAASIPEGILSIAVSRDRDWIKTVLAMLSVYFSGITLADRRLIRISDSAQHMLELFSFGGQFNQHQKVEAWKFLAHSNLRQHSEDLLREFQAIVTGQYDEPKILMQMDYLFFFKRTALFAERVARFENLEQDYTQHMGIARDYIYSWAALQWGRFIESETVDEDRLMVSNSPEDNYTTLCYQIVRFFRRLLEYSVDAICSGTVISLSRGDIQSIQMSLRHISDYNHDLKRKKDALINQLNLALYADKADSKARVNAGKGNKSVTIPSNAFVSYLDTLEYMLHEPADDSQYVFYTGRPDVSSYFELLQYLRLEDDPLDSDYFYPTNLPMTTLVVTNLKMLEYLMPYYFAASMLILLDTRYPSEIPWQSSISNSKHMELDRTDQVLMEFFRRITRLDKPRGETSQDKLHLLLWETMREVQDELARQYYNYLEAMHE